MKEFKASCIDNETNMELVLSEVSYNRACDWLAQHGFTEYKKFHSTLRYITMEFDRKTFIYDEERGYLLSKR